MSHRENRKLRLRRETLRDLQHRLDDEALARVMGGNGNGFSVSGASLAGTIKC